LEELELMHNNSTGVKYNFVNRFTHNSKLFTYMELEDRIDMESNNQFLF